MKYLLLILLLLLFSLSYGQNPLLSGFHGYGDVITAQTDGSSDSTYIVKFGFEGGYFNGGQYDLDSLSVGDFFFIDCGYFEIDSIITKSLNIARVVVLDASKTLTMPPVLGRCVIYNPTTTKLLTRTARVALGEAGISATEANCIINHLVSQLENSLATINLGTGTDTYIPRWDGTSLFENSNIYNTDDGLVVFTPIITASQPIGIEGGKYYDDDIDHFYYYDGSAYWRLPKAKEANFTTGSVVFAGSSLELTEDNAGLFFDSANNRLGIGTNAPASGIMLYSTAATTNTPSQGITFGTHPGEQAGFYQVNSGLIRVNINNSTSLGELQAEKYNGKSTNEYLTFGEGTTGSLLKGLGGSSNTEFLKFQGGSTLNNTTADLYGFRTQGSINPTSGSNDVVIWGVGFGAAWSGALSFTGTLTGLLVSPRLGDASVNSATKRNLLDVGINTSNLVNYDSHTSKFVVDFDGQLGFQDDTPDYLQDMGGITDDGVRFPNVASYPVGAAGVLLYDPDTTAFRFHNGTSWVTIADSGGSGAAALNYWTKTGSDVYYSTGQVAIGTSTMEGALNIVGNIGTDIGSNNVFLDASSNFASGDNNFVSGSSNLDDAVIAQNSVAIGSSNFTLADNAYSSVGLGEGNFNSLGFGASQDAELGTIGIGYLNFVNAETGDASVALGALNGQFTLHTESDVMLGYFNATYVDTLVQNISLGYYNLNRDATAPVDRVSHAIVMGYQNIDSSAVADSVIIIGYRNARSNTYDSPIIIANNTEAAIDFHAIVGGDYYKRFSSGLYSFNVDQDTTSKDGYALKFNSSGGEIELQEAGKLWHDFTSRTANDTIVVTNKQYIIIDATSGNITFGIDVSSLTTGSELQLILETNSNTITIETDGTEQFRDVNGTTASSVSESAGNIPYTLIWDGTYLRY